MYRKNEHRRFQSNTGNEDELGAHVTCSQPEFHVYIIYVATSMWPGEKEQRSTTQVCIKLFVIVRRVMFLSHFFDTTAYIVVSNRVACRLNNVVGGSIHVL